jgi:hypothetical protein
MRQHLINAKTHLIGAALDLRIATGECSLEVRLRRTEEAFTAVAEALTQINMALREDDGDANDKPAAL